MSTTIKNRLIAAAGGFLLVLAMGLAMAAPASAAGPNSVNNSGYSAQAILICSPNDPCVRREPGETMYQSTDGGWNPDSVAVCPYCTAQYRAVAPSGYVTGWVTQRGSRYGTWIDTGAVHRMWGQGTQVQVIMSAPNY